VHQEISYKQQIMTWSQDKYNVSGRKIVKSVAKVQCNDLKEIKKISTLLKGS
jgi:hypothetical protein